MATQGLSDLGEEWMQKFAWRQDLLGTRDTTITFLLYLDSTDYNNDGNVEGDQLTDASDIGAVTTEPGDGNYVRTAKTLDQDPDSNSGDGFYITQDANGDIEVRAQPSFDVTNTTGYVDAWAAVVDFQSDVVNSEAGQNTHLIATGKFDGGALNLEQSTDVNVDAYITLD
jgi:hypothetical protein